MFLSTSGLTRLSSPLWPDRPLHSDMPVLSTSVEQTPGLWYECFIATLDSSCVPALTSFWFSQHLVWVPFQFLVTPSSGLWSSCCLTSFSFSHIRSSHSRETYLVIVLTVLSITTKLSPQPLVWQFLCSCPLDSGTTILLACNWTVQMIIMVSGIH